MSGSRYAKLPAGKVIILASSNWSPIPTLKFPEITVTFSRLGCQCGAILWPSGILSHDGEIAGSRGWVALQHGYLRAGSNKRRWRPVFDLVRSERILVRPRLGKQY